MSGMEDACPITTDWPIPGPEMAIAGSPGWVSGDLGAEHPGDRL
jgi:hypothetical protein